MNALRPASWVFRKTVGRSAPPVQRDAAERVLLLLSACFGIEDKPEAAVAKIDWRTLVEMVGVMRSRFILSMNTFYRPGFIDRNGWSHVRRLIRPRIVSRAVRFRLRNGCRGK